VVLSEALRGKPRGILACFGKESTGRAGGFEGLSKQKWGAFTGALQIKVHSLCLTDSSINLSLVILVNLVRLTPS
jgi:hypothetical protein